MEKKYDIIRLEKKHMKRCFEICCEHFKFFDEYVGLTLLPMNAPYESDLEKLIERANVLGYGVLEKESIGDVSVGKLHGFVIFEKKKKYIKVEYLMSTAELYAKTFPVLIKRLDEFLNGSIESIIIELRSQDKKWQKILEENNYIHVQSETKNNQETLLFSKSLVDTPM